MILHEKKLIIGKETVIVAVSAGPDSIALLCLLAEAVPDCRLIAAYVDHNLRPAEAHAEKALLAALCAGRQLSCEIRSVDVRGELSRGDESPEACARRLRYQALEEIRQAYGAELIAVGHTSDDQAEEILIRLIRGSGLKGLSGMAFVSGRIIRPLLATSKEQLLSYLHQQQIDYCIDSSNTSQTFLRNRVRQDLLPLLERGFNPAMRQTLLHTAAILQDEEAYLADHTERLYETAASSRQFREHGRIVSELGLTIELLTRQHPAIGRRLIEKFCWASSCRPRFSAIEAILKLAGQGRTGAELHLCGTVRVVRTASHLLFLRHEYGQSGRRWQLVDFGPPVAIAQPGGCTIVALGKTLTLAISETEPETSDTLQVIDAQTAPFPLLLRAALPGESFIPLGAPGSKKINRLLSDRKIPRQLRYRYPVLVCGESIVAIPGLTICEPCKITPATSRYLVISWR